LKWFSMQWGGSENRQFQNDWESKNKLYKYIPQNVSPPP
jgi:hypothetical protein